jgi:SAM-dependent methyltransferase
VAESQELLEAHYRLERALADQLRAAPKEARPRLYREVYDRLNAESPLYRAQQRAPDPASRDRGLRKLLAILTPHLGPEMRVLEIGPGDGALSRALAARVRSVTAVDVATGAFGDDRPANLELVLTEGAAVPVAAASFDLAFSNQVMEHLHPDDALDQLRAIRRALAPGGSYLCLTPNRLTGPHDISKHFDREATGLHLHEYTTGELARRFREAGFEGLRALAGSRGRFLALPTGIAALLEAAVGALPGPMRRPVARFWPIRAAIGVALLGRAAV